MLCVMPMLCCMHAASTRGWRAATDWLLKRSFVMTGPSCNRRTINDNPQLRHLISPRINHFKTLESLATDPTQ
ncbi:hypothetical protein BDZ91DRAFT_736093 [Kalaharituber pfeilii]|nr:hypothetical protein BDZ91DRAFT_736093 [Kalaharituber pfeilii]